MNRKSIWDVFGSDIAEREPLMTCAQPISHNYIRPNWFEVSHEDISNTIKGLQEGSDVLCDQTLHKNDKFHYAFETTLARYIFGSNRIENTGPGWSETLQLCQAYLRGEIGSNDSRLDVPSTNALKLKSSREVIQHADAFLYVKQVTKAHGCLTLETLLEGHRRLTAGLETEDGIQGYQGMLRTIEVHVGQPAYDVDDALIKTELPEMVPRKIEQWLLDYNLAFKDPVADPISIAARLKFVFVAIHPFVDGNGRMSRLLANVLISHHLPKAIIAMGSNGKAKKQYNQTIKRCFYLKDYRPLSFLMLREAAKSQGELLEVAKETLPEASSDHQSTTKPNLLTKSKSKLKTIIKKLRPIIGGSDERHKPHS